MLPRPPPTGAARVVGAALLLWSSAACSVVDPRRELRDRIEPPAAITGTVTGAAGGKPVVVVLIERETFGDDDVSDCWLLHRPGRFTFLRRPGTYRVFAFEDANGNLTPDRDERVGWYGRPADVRATSGIRTDGLEVRLVPNALGGVARGAPRLAASALRRCMDRRHAGEVAELGDARFSAQGGKLGLWDPVRFDDTLGTGVWFLQPYHPAKIPVLLVHGASGYPQEWADVVAGIDRSRFQPWVFQYPSGARLDAVRDALVDVVLELRERHGFATLIVVAHSMGGLVSRAAIPRLEDETGRGFVTLFVSISTPWLGHGAAGLGVARSPFVVPSWNDMAPESIFLRTLRDEPLPPTLAYHLLFGYRGGETLFMRENSDRSVTLQSVLDPRAQDEAVRVRGFFEDHVSILRSGDVVRALARLMHADAPAP
jgi:pimeloyl-ACP methyl ester carboxylesterase